MGITEFFKNSVLKREQKNKPPEWWEDPDQSYVTIYSTVASEVTWNGTRFVPNKPVVCRICGRDDHWKLGGHPGFLPHQMNRGLFVVFVCEHEPISVGRNGIRCIVSIPIRFVS